MCVSILDLGANWGGALDSLPVALATHTHLMIYSLIYQSLVLSYDFALTGYRNKVPSHLLWDTSYN